MADVIESLDEVQYYEASMFFHIKAISSTIIGYEFNILVCGLMSFSGLSFLKTGVTFASFQTDVKLLINVC